MVVKVNHQSMVIFMDALVMLHFIQIFSLRHHRDVIGYHLPWQSVGKAWLGSVLDPVTCRASGSCGEEQHRAAACQ